MGHTQYIKCFDKYKTFVSLKKTASRCRIKSNANLQKALEEVTVLITGESGTGKELIARVVHNLSIRKNRPLVKVKAMDDLEGERRKRRCEIAEYEQNNL